MRCYCACCSCDYVPISLDTARMVLAEPLPWCTRPFVIARSLRSPRGFTVPQRFEIFGYLLENLKIRLDYVGTDMDTATATATVTATTLATTTMLQRKGEKNGEKGFRTTQRALILLGKGASIVYVVGAAGKLGRKRVVVEFQHRTRGKLSLTVYGDTKYETPYLPTPTLGGNITANEITLLKVTYFVVR
uniref:Uncharacterized protein n=1 Tax=Vespula pensylvanica TaxID=30213 RepID=A0A834P6D9_VESPE|nr:hypothetical protein H0235_006226 [Vespula pensylvanica]